jgi:DNA modification methylase
MRSSRLAEGVSGYVSVRRRVGTLRDSASIDQLYYGDNLQVLPEHIADESVDLTYLDPPFNSKRDYNRP